MDIALKQRLVGAVVLIALAVVVLPMLLGGRPEAGLPETRKIELPPQPPEMDFETRRFPVGESPARLAPQDAGNDVEVKSLPAPASSTKPEAETGPVAAGSMVPAPAAEAVAAAAPEPEEAVAEPAGGPEMEATAQEAAPAPVETSPPPIAATESPASTPPEGRYVVQVASFGSMDNANRLSGTLRGLGYNVLLDSIKSEVGTLNRVRVGPFPSETEANRAVARLKSQVGDVQPRVMDLQPDMAAQVTSPSDPLVRWVVQVGSFSSATNAENLVSRLRKESLSAYSEKVSGSGSTIYRVRVGPFLERDEAIRIEGLVKERMSLDGVVMSED